MKLLTLARDLRRRKARERQALFVAEGVRTVEELLRSSIHPVGALVAPNLAETPRGLAVRQALAARGVAIQDVDTAEFASAADTESPQGVLAIARVPDRHLDQVEFAGGGPLLVLDGIQDPGNVGTILRTAAALRATATLAMPGTVDLWNAKVVRSAMGAHFHHPAMAASWEEFDAFRARHTLDVWGADAAGEPAEALRAAAPLAIVVGNEGNGLGPSARERAGRLVALPIDAAVESLNVAVATGILLYLFRR